MTYFDSACQYHRWLASHATPLHFSSLCARCEGDWEEGITMQLHEFILPCIASCTLRCPFPHSPCRVLLATAAPQTVQIVIMWTAPFTDRSSEKVSHRVSRPKKISPSSQYPNTGIVRTLMITKVTGSNASNSLSSAFFFISCNEVQSPNIHVIIYTHSSSI